MSLPENFNPKEVFDKSELSDTDESRLAEHALRRLGQIIENNPQSSINAILIAGDNRLFMIYAEDCSDVWFGNPYSTDFSTVGADFEAITLSSDSSRDIRQIHALLDQIGNADDCPGVLVFDFTSSHNFFEQYGISDVGNHHFRNGLTDPEYFLNDNFPEYTEATVLDDDLDVDLDGFSWR